jgi:general secretion pathway protein G
MERTWERRARAAARGGFTLIEVLLVVAILGILAGVVVVNFAGKQKGAMVKACRASIQNICTAVDMYEVDTGRFPANLDALVNSDGAPNWNGPYLKGGVPVDPWGNAFVYERLGDKYRVKSGGPGDGSGEITSQ